MSCLEGPRRRGRMPSMRHAGSHSGRPQPQTLAGSSDGYSRLSSSSSWPYAASRSSAASTTAANDATFCRGSRLAAACNGPEEALWVTRHLECMPPLADDMSRLCNSKGFQGTPSRSHFGRGRSCPANQRTPTRARAALGPCTPHRPASSHCQTGPFYRKLRSSVMRATLKCDAGHHLRVNHCDRYASAPCCGAGCFERGFPSWMLLLPAEAHIRSCKIDNK